MRLLVPALLAVLLFAPLGPAAAQTEVGVQLGMSPAEARAALPGAEDVPANENRRTRLLHRKEPLRWAGRVWTSAFVHFGTDDRVRSISLGAEPTQRAELEAWLTGRYGPPVEVEGNPVLPAGSTMGFYTARFRDPATGAAAVLNFLVLAGTTLVTVDFRAPDPAAEAARREAQRRFELRQKGLLGLPPTGDSWCSRARSPGSDATGRPSASTSTATTGFRASFFGPAPKNWPRSTPPCGPPTARRAGWMANCRSAAAISPPGRSRPRARSSWCSP